MLVWVTAAFLCQGLAWLYSLLCFRVKDYSGSVVSATVISMSSRLPLLVLQILHACIPT